MEENLNIVINGENMNISLKGRIGALVADSITQEVLEKLEGIKHVYIDFKNVDYISSTGLRFLLVVQNEINDIDGGTMELSSVPEVVMNVFEATGFTSILNIK